MAGHSKWANIQHRKGKQDKLRSKMFSKLSKEITVAAKMGGTGISGHKLKARKHHDRNQDQREDGTRGPPDDQTEHSDAFKPRLFRDKIDQVPADVVLIERLDPLHIAGENAQAVLLIGNEGSAVFEQDPLRLLIEGARS